MHSADPHKTCTLHYAGAALDRADRVVLAAHGRYGTAADILALAEQVAVPNVAWVAPQATGNSWWEQIFLAPLAENEPGLSSALSRVSHIADDLARRGFGPEQTVLVGFSQGACLILEHVARSPRPWLGVVAMSGGLIGTSDSSEPPNAALHGHSPKRFDYPPALGGLPIYLGCHQEDPVIPIARVRKSKEVLHALGAEVTLHEEAGRMHGISPADIDALARLLHAPTACNMRGLPPA